MLRRSKPTKTSYLAREVNRMGILVVERQAHHLYKQNTSVKQNPLVFKVDARWISFIARLGTLPEIIMKVLYMEWPLGRPFVPNTKQVVNSTSMMIPPEGASTGLLRQLGCQLRSWCGPQRASHHRLSDGATGCSDRGLLRRTCGVVSFGTCLRLLRITHVMF